MKKVRFLIMSAFLAAALFTTTMVCVGWKEHGCEWKSLVAACVFYPLSSFAVWYVIDKSLREHLN